MARGPTTFRQRDATALIKAVRAAGLNVARVEVGKDGKIAVFTTEGAGLAAEINEWDEALARGEQALIERARRWRG
jgi:hypothetical protein